MVSTIKESTKSSVNLPLANADFYYSQLIENDHTMGTSEQKALVLRRRFDYILRMSTGTFEKDSSFYKNALSSVLKSLNVSRKKTNEMQCMRLTFNQFMHEDVDIDDKIYKLMLDRMATFVSIVTAQPIPDLVRGMLPSFTRTSKKTSDTIIPIYCCIDACSVLESTSKDSFNKKAQAFRRRVLHDSRINKIVDFKFVVAREKTFSIRDMGNEAPILVNASRPKEEALAYAAKELKGKKKALFMILYGGQQLNMNTDEIALFHELNKYVKLYPIALPGADSTMIGNLVLQQKVIKMREDRFDEFFSWLFDSILVMCLK